MLKNEIYAVLHQNLPDDVKYPSLDREFLEWLADEIADACLDYLEAAESEYCSWPGKFPWLEDMIQKEQEPPTWMEEGSRDYPFADEPDMLT